MYRKGVRFVGCFTPSDDPSGKIWMIKPDGSWGPGTDACYITIDRYRSEAVLKNIEKKGVDTAWGDAVGYSWRAGYACCERHNVNPRLHDTPHTQASYFFPPKKGGDNGD